MLQLIGFDLLQLQVCFSITCCNKFPTNSGNFFTGNCNSVKWWQSEKKSYKNIFLKQFSLEAVSSTCWAVNKKQFQTNQIENRSKQEEKKSWNPISQVLRLLLILSPLFSSAQSSKTSSRLFYDFWEVNEVHKELERKIHQQAIKCLL